MVRPVIEQAVEAVVQVAMAVVEVDVAKALATYCVITEPPLVSGTVHETSAAPVSDTATTAVGESGRVKGVAVTAVDGAPVPMVLSARNCTG